MKYLLKDLAIIQIGYQLRSKIQLESDGLYKIIQAKDINRDLILNHKDAYSIDIEGKPDKYLIDKDDLLFLSRGTNNFAVVINKRLSNTVASGLFYIIKINPDIILPEYLAWYINLPQTQKLLALKSQGTNIPLITIATFRNLEIPLPPLEIQQKIAALSRLINKEKELTKKLIKKREQITQAICLNSIKSKGDNIL